jgi:hypothetical protein
MVYAKDQVDVLSILPKPLELAMIAFEKLMGD